MASQNCPAVTANLQIFVETGVDCSFIYKFKNWLSLKLLIGFSNETLKNTLCNVFQSCAVHAPIWPPPLVTVRTC